MTPTPPPAGIPVVIGEFDVHYGPLAAELDPPTAAVCTLRQIRSMVDELLETKRAR